MVWFMVVQCRGKTEKPIKKEKEEGSSHNQSVHGGTFFLFVSESVAGVDRIFRMFSVLSAGMDAFRIVGEFSGKEFLQGCVCVSFDTGNDA